jgi:hypothetical protein
LVAREEESVPIASVLDVMNGDRIGVMMVSGLASVNSRPDD